MNHRTLLSVACATLVSTALPAHATLLTDPNDARSWQGATVGTFAQLYHGADNAANRQQVIDDQLLDDGNFDSTGYVSGQIIKYNGSAVAGPLAGATGTSFDQPGVSDANDGTYNYGTGSGDVGPAANAVDAHWIQTDNVVGNTVWDLGFKATKAAIFNTIDHGPLPLEAIESTVYLSNDLVNWTVAVTERVWLEGIFSDTSVVWDGFVYAVGTGTSDTFRYASVIWGGPGGLQADGDNEINAIMGLRGDFTGNPVPEPASLALSGLALAGFGALRRRRSQA